MAGGSMWVLYPELFLQNSWLDKLYGVAAFFSGYRNESLEGAVLTGQVILPLYTNMTDDKKYIRPGVITSGRNFVCRVVFWDNLLPEILRATGWEWILSFAISRQMAVGGWEQMPDLPGRVPVTVVNGLFPKWKRVTGSVWGRYNEPRYGLEIDLAAIRLVVWGIWAGRLDIRRHFWEVTVGVYGMVTDGGDERRFPFRIACSRNEAAEAPGCPFCLPEYFGYGIPGPPWVCVWRKVAGI